jgi:hypothetical protein
MFLCLWAAVLIDAQFNRGIEWSKSRQGRPLMDKETEESEEQESARLNEEFRSVC